MFKRKCSAIALTTILIVSTILTGCSNGGSNTEIVRKTSENNQVVVELESPTPVPSEAPEEVTPTPEPEEIEDHNVRIFVLPHSEKYKWQLVKKFNVKNLENI